jgi:hypothetical protein
MCICKYSVYNVRRSRICFFLYFQCSTQFCGVRVHTTNTHKARSRETRNATTVVYLARAGWAHNPSAHPSRRPLQPGSRTRSSTRRTALRSSRSGTGGYGPREGHAAPPRSAATWEAPGTQRRPAAWQRVARDPRVAHTQDTGTAQPRPRPKSHKARCSARAR